jgi:sulfur-carrier protein adenylyltransferase/sulfurtransferase
MTMPLTHGEIEYYSRQLKLPEIGLHGQEKLKNAKVLCVGAGGLAAPLLLYLAAAGIGTIGIVDKDTLETSNLHRQVLYRYAQRGLSKIAVAKRELLALNPAITVELYPLDLHPDNALDLVQNYHIVADCTDNFATRYLINDVCFYARIPYLYASVQQFQGQCSLFAGHVGPCLRCLFPTPPQAGVIPRCSEAGVLGVLPGLLGTLQATEIIKWILQQGQSLHGKLLTLDALNMEFKQFNLPKNPECKLCVYRTPIKELLKSTTETIRYAISAQGLQKALQHKKNLLLIDVRDPEERDRDNPLGGRLIPLAVLANYLSDFDPNQAIVVYCHSGLRSQMAVKLFLHAGFAYVKFLQDGLIGWKKETLLT